MCVYIYIYTHVYILSTATSLLPFPFGRLSFQKCSAYVHGFRPNHVNTKYGIPCFVSRQHFLNVFTIAGVTCSC